MYKVGRTLFVVIILLILLAVVPPARAATEYADRGSWAPNVWYNVGDTVTHNGVLYQNIQAHTSQIGWEPPNVPALWNVSSGGPTPTRTNTPSGPPATPTRTRTPTATLTSGGSRGTCWAAWNAGTVYTGGAHVSHSGGNYQAAYWTQGNDPLTHSGPPGSGQPWIPMGVCGGGTSPTVTRTNTPSAPTLTPTRTPTGTSSNWPSRVSAIYADISFTSIQAAYQATGHEYYALAFVLGNEGTCAPAWDGTHLMPENYYAGEINAVRAAGGDVIAVFGGANGSDLAAVCTTVSSLQAAYQSVLDQYQFTWIDLNIEGWMVTNSTAIDRLNKAIKGLQNANAGLRVSYTLPVLQSGLPQAELNVLNNAKSNGVRVDYVNVMTMNYGPAGIDMGQAAIDAASNTRNQLVNIGIPAQIGITPMIGQNNTQGEIFYLSDANQLVTYAQANNYVGWLTFWSVGRDNGSCPGQTAASASCSGISQTNYAFTNIFKTFP